MLTGFFGPRFLLDEDSTGDGGGGGNTTTSDAEKLASLEKKLAALESTNERLLKQSQEHKEAKNKMKEELEAVEKKRLEKDGDTQGLLLKEKEKNKVLENERSKLTHEVLTGKIHAAVAKVASDAHDIDLVLTAGDMSILVVDRDNMKVSNVEAFVESVRKSSPYLFGNSKKPYGNHPPNPKDTRPPNRHQGGSNDFIRDMENVKTEAERDAVMKKYNRVPSF